MTMQCHWEICVSKDGRHLFATAPRSLTERSAAWALFYDFEHRFPETEGYKVNITYWEVTGHSYRSEGGETHKE